MEIKGKTVIITGAGSGLGAATAKYFSNLGARVAWLDIDITHVRAQTKQGQDIAIPCDVTDPIHTEQALKLITDQLGPIMACINCAGIAPAKRIVGKSGAIALDDFKQVINVNLIGTFNVLRLAAEAMSTADPLEDNERGIIINTASIAAYEGQIGQAAYSASKGGVIALTLPAARELAQHGIRVVTIAPGIFETPLLLNMPESVQMSLASQIPFPKRLGKPTEYAALVHHIIENKMINAEVIRLDGGIRMGEK